MLLLLLLSLLSCLVKQLKSCLKNKIKRVSFLKTENNIEKSGISEL